MTVTYVSEGDVCMITLNRPEALNAVNADMLGDISETFQRFEADRNSKVAILTGAGKSFCAGVDIKSSVASHGPGVVAAPATDFGPFWTENKLNKPVIAAVNGYAMGVGFILSTLTSDLCIASESAVFQMSEVARGMVGGWEWGWQHGWSRQACMEVALGYRLSAYQAHTYGIVAEVVKDDALIQRALDRARHLLSIPPQALKAHRHLVRELLPKVPDDLVAISDVYSHRLDGSHDQVEAVRSWIEKRAPNYSDYGC